jgi:hypothetical protein
MRRTLLLGLTLLMLPQTKAHVSIFVTSVCPISNYYAPEVQRLCADYERRGLTCSLVYEDVTLDEGQMRTHMTGYGYGGLTAAIDHDRALARRAGATVTPQAVLTDEHGQVRYRGRIDNRYESFGKPRRVVTEHNLRDAVEAVLSGKPVPRADTPAIGCHIVFPPPARIRP